MLLSINICYSNEMSAHTQTVNTWRIRIFISDLYVINVNKDK